MIIRLRGQSLDFERVCGYADTTPDGTLTHAGMWMLNCKMHARVGQWTDIYVGQRCRTQIQIDGRVGFRSSDSPWGQMRDLEA